MSNNFGSVMGGTLLTLTTSNTGFNDTVPTNNQVRAGAGLGRGRGTTDNQVRAEVP